MEYTLCTENKVNWITTTYEIGNGFLVDIVNLKNGYYDVWLHHKDIGKKEYVFGLHTNRAYVIKLINNNIIDYIVLYEEKYMQNYWGNALKCFDEP